MTHSEPLSQTLLNLCREHVLLLEKENLFLRAELERFQAEVEALKDFEIALLNKEAELSDTKLGVREHCKVLEATVHNLQYLMNL